MNKQNMQKLTLTVTDENKLSFILELLNQFDFVEIQEQNVSRKKNSQHNFFASAGLWKNRSISAEQLRSQAWKRNR